MNLQLDDVDVFVRIVELGSLSAAVQLSVNAVTKAREVIYVSISQSDAINEAKMLPIPAPTPERPITARPAPIV